MIGVEIVPDVGHWQHIVRLQQPQTQEEEELSEPVLLCSAVSLREQHSKSNHLLP